MHTGDRTLVQDIQSLLTLLVTVHAASLSAIYTHPSKVKEFHNCVYNLKVLFSSIRDMVSSCMSWGLCSGKYQDGLLGYGTMCLGR